MTALPENAGRHAAPGDPFTTAAKQVEKIRGALLFGETEDTPTFGLVADEHLLLALAALETAMCHLRLASYAHTRRVAGRG